MKTIFAKVNDNDETEQKYIKLSEHDIDTIIPKEAKNEIDVELSKTHTEWRWRYFRIIINNKVRKFIEISNKKVDSDRLYKTRDGKWSNDNNGMGSEWDKYVTKTKYYYCKQ